LIIYAALAEGSTSFTTTEITEHLKTNIEIVKKFVKRRIDIDEASKTITIN
jgi:RNA 3'-terminal phosphate cyclase